MSGAYEGKPRLLFGEDLPRVDREHRFPSRSPGPQPPEGCMNKGKCSCKFLIQLVFGKEFSHLPNHLDCVDYLYIYIKKKKNSIPKG